MRAQSRETSMEEGVSYIYTDKDGHIYETDVPLSPEELQRFGLVLTALAKPTGEVGP